MVRALLLLLLVLAGRTSLAQEQPCADALTAAEARYIAQDYAAVEPLAMACVYQPAADSTALLRSYRLLALAFAKQDLLAEAQATIVKLLSIDFGYAPDPIQDPPLYVALVTAVKDQLRVTPPAPRENGFTVGGRLNINTATAEALESLGGIGPVLAGRIVAYRTSSGPFESPEDLMEVRGIGPQTYELLAPYVTIDGPDTSAGAAGGLPSRSPDLATALPEAEAPLPARGADLVVDLNAASIPELQQLDGIGPVLAERIAAYRTSNGPFQRTEDLMEVRGIGPRTYERLAPHLTIRPTAD